MSCADWKDQVSSFKTIDVRGIQGNFFQGLKKQAMALPAGGGLEIIQSFVLAGIDITMNQFNKLGKGKG